LVEASHFEPLHAIAGGRYQQLYPCQGRFLRNGMSQALSALLLWNFLFLLLFGTKQYQGKYRTSQGVAYHKIS
jgi:hypothetical protein